MKIRSYSASTDKADVRRIFLEGQNGVARGGVAIVALAWWPFIGALCAAIAAIAFMIECNAIHILLAAVASFLGVICFLYFSLKVSASNYFRNRITFFSVSREILKRVSKK